MNNLSDNDYAGMRRVCYDGGATFVPVCETCGRFVKADKEIKVCLGGGTLSPDTNATCAKCGRTHMIFEGFM